MHMYVESIVDNTSDDNTISAHHLSQKAEK